MVTFRFGVKSPILPMNENSHLFRQIYERRLVFAQSLGFKKILSALPIEGGGEPLAELLKFLPYHRPPPFQSAQGANSTNNDEDLTDSRRRKKEEDSQKRSHHHHRPMCEITRLAGFALAGNIAQNRTKKGVWRLGRWPQDEGAISDAKNGVTGGKKVTTLLRFTTEKERMERGRGEKKSFLRLRARKRQIEPRAGEQAGWAVLAAKDGHPPKKGSDKNKRRGRYCARDTTSLRSKKRQKSRGKYGSFCLPTRSVFVPWAL